MDAFWDFAARKGILVSPEVYVDASPLGGRGVFLRGRVEAKQPLAFVPRGSFLVGVDFLNTCHGQVVLEWCRMPTVMASSTLLLFYLMRERLDVLSEWKPYLDVFPRAFPSVDAKKPYESFFPALSEMYPDLFPACSYTYEVFQWALGVIQTRAVATRDGSAIIPIVDFANHSSGAERIVLAEDASGVWWTSQSERGPGEVLCNYDPRASESEINVRYLLT